MRQMIHSNHESDQVQVTSSAVPGSIPSNSGAKRRKANNQKGPQIQVTSSAVPGSVPSSGSTKKKQKIGKQKAKPNAKKVKSRCVAENHAISSMTMFNDGHIGLKLP